MNSMKVFGATLFLMLAVGCGPSLTPGNGLSSDEEMMCLEMPGGDSM
jgi:hypothetical protein